MSFGIIGVAAALAIAALGSSMGIGAAGTAAIGSWKRCYSYNKAAPFLLVAFVGAPLSQTLYGYILMNTVLLPLINQGYDWLLLSVGVLGGSAIAVSAWQQGKAAAAAAHALAETGKGFARYIIVIGIIETVAMFVMVFLLFAVSVSV